MRQLTRSAPHTFSIPLRASDLVCGCRHMVVYLVAKRRRPVHNRLAGSGSCGPNALTEIATGTRPHESCTSSRGMDPRLVPVLRGRAPWGSRVSRRTAPHLAFGVPLMGRG